MNQHLPLVFVVDDDPAARKSLSALVESHGGQAQVFASAEEFLANYDRQRAACLVTDVRMLGMSGLELQEQLLKEDKALPVIVITAFADVPQAVRAMRSGAVTFLQKSCGDHELWEAIQRALTLAQSQGVQQRRETLRQLANLRPDDRAVLDLLVAGKSNKAIAAELRMGLRTVEARRQALFRRLNTHSLAVLVRRTLEALDPTATAQQ
ncbi:MAG: response regulator transcription factor [Pirellulales bacterium]